MCKGFVLCSTRLMSLLLSDILQVVSGDNSISDVGTEYESMDGDCLYEVLDDLFVKERQEHVGKPSTEQNNKSLTGRVKKNVDRAAHYLGKIRHLRKRCKVVDAYMYRCLLMTSQWDDVYLCWEASVPHNAHSIQYTGTLQW